MADVMGPGPGVSHSRSVEAHLTRVEYLVPGPLPLPLNGEANTPPPRGPGGGVRSSTEACVGPSFEGGEGMGGVDRSRHRGVRLRERHMAWIPFRTT